MADISEISESLCVSGYRSVQVDILRIYDVSCVINTAAEIPPMKTEHLDFPLEYIHVPMYDNESENLLKYVDKCVDKIYRVELEGGKTLVHCVGGVSRSVSVCAAYFIKYCGMSLKEAMSKIIAVRPQANPNPAFYLQLEEYERFFSRYRKDNPKHFGR